MPKQPPNRKPPLTALEVPAKPAGWHGDGDGLYLLVSKTGGRSWVFRYKRGKVTNLGLGGYPKLGLMDARKLAKDYQKLLDQGLDPKTERERAADRAPAGTDDSFAGVAEVYMESLADRLKGEKFQKGWAQSVRTHAFPTLGRIPVGQITVHDIHRMITPIWKDKHPMAERVLRRVATIIDWATAKEFRTGDNPAKLDGPLKHLLPPVRVPEKHYKAMPFEDLPAFVRDLRTEGVVSHLALEFAILTALRTGEVLGALWSEIDLGEKLWTLPPPRHKTGMKTGKPHVVPLSPQALAVLKQAAEFRRDDCVFPSVQNNGKRLSDMSMLMVLRKLGVEEVATVHGFRSTFRDWAAETTDHPNEVVEMALAHTIPSKVERAYRRGDLLAKRRLLMDDWGKFCAGE